MNADTHSDRILRVTVVGAGAIGGLIAACTACAGHEVSVLDRNKTQEAAGSSPLAPAKGSEHSLKLVGEWVEDLPRMERRQRDHRLDLGRSDLGPSTADQ